MSVAQFSAVAASIVPGPPFALSPKTFAWDEGRRKEVRVNYDDVDHYVLELVAS